MVSKLYKALKDCPKPIFECTMTGEPARYDDDLTGATIHHGGAEPAGVPVPTLEVGFLGYVSPVAGRSAALQLTAPAAAWIKSVTGAAGTGAADIGPRFTGRTGAYTVDDTHTGQNTTMTAAGWTAQLANRSTVHTFNRGAWVHEVITALLRDPTLAVLPTVTRQPAREKFGQIYDPLPGVKYSELIGKLTTDLGILVQQWRSGVLEIVPLSHRKTKAAAAAETYPPITRGQILSPAQWSTRSENDPSNHRIVTRDGAGAPVSLNFGDLNEPWRDKTETDLQYLYFTDPEQWHTLGYTRRYREYSGAYSLPEIEIDLLLLFKRGRPYDLLQAGALLALNAGDPVTFAGDWYPTLRGVFFAEQISETITPDSWKIRLTLVPLGHVTASTQPGIRPRIWDQATDTWDQATGTWNSY